jgi:hypothetical protein
MLCQCLGENSPVAHVHGAAVERIGVLHRLQVLLLLLILCLGGGQRCSAV